MASQTVENYIKCIFQLSEKEGTEISTSSLAEHLGTTSASVTDMIRKLADQNLVDYKKYHGVQLTLEGKSMAINILRKHRLWETFLHQKLDISWNKVHEIAEQLEHVQKDLLIEKLDDYLGKPKFDPHGDPIPDAQGRFTLRSQVLLSHLNVGDEGKIVAVRKHDTGFLDYLDSRGLRMDTHLQVVEKILYDGSLKLKINDGKEIMIVQELAHNIYIKKQR